MTNNKKLKEKYGLIEYIYGVIETAKNRKIYAAASSIDFLCKLK